MSPAFSKYGVLFIMAQYVVKIKQLRSLSERMISLEKNIVRVREQLDTIHADLPSGFISTKQQISATIESVRRSSKHTEEMRKVLQNVAEVYGKAEQKAIYIPDSTEKNVKKPNTPLRLRVRPEKSQGVFFRSNLILPDWLQLAVLKYEQSR